MIVIITAVITWLGLRRIAFCFPGNTATCLTSKPTGTDLPTTASLQNAYGTWRHAAKNLPKSSQTHGVLLEADYASSRFWVKFKLLSHSVPQQTQTRQVKPHVSMNSLHQAAKQGAVHHSKLWWCVSPTWRWTFNISYPSYRARIQENPQKWGLNHVWFREEYSLLKVRRNTFLWNQISGAKFLPGLKQLVETYSITDLKSPHWQHNLPTYWKPAGNVELIHIC